MAEKRISLAEAEVRSRILGRHKEILNDRKQDEQIAAIQTRLEQLQQQGASALVHAPDEAELLPIEDDEAAA